MAYDWLGWAIPAATALAQGYMAKKNTDSLKADAKHQQNEWERAMQLQQQNIYEARNSPFAKVGMTMLDQMLHVYGDQSKGRGGFTLPVDQLSSMLGSFGSFGNAENRQTIAGANPDASTGWYGPGNGNPGLGNDYVHRGGPRETNPGAEGGLGGEMLGGIGESAFADEARQYAATHPGMSLGDAARNLAWRYAELDGNPYGPKGTMMGEMKQRAAKAAAGQAVSAIPYGGLLGRPALGWAANKADKLGFKGMFNYDNWGVAPQVAWNVSPHMFASRLDALERANGDQIMADALFGYGTSFDNPLLSALSSAMPVTNKYTTANQTQSRIHPSDLAGQMAFYSGETGNYLY